MILPLLFLLGFLIRITVASTTFGTWDMESIYVVADLLKKNLPVYEATWRLNSPPPWMLTIGILSSLADVTKIPLSFWARMPFILGDMGIGVLIYKIAKWKKYQEKLAVEHFDSAKIQGIDKGFVSSPVGEDNREKFLISNNMLWIRG